MKNNIELNNQNNNLSIDFLKSLLNDKTFDRLILEGNTKTLKIDDYGSIDFDENNQAILSEELYYKLYNKKPRRWSDTNLAYTDNGKLFLNNNYKKFREAILKLEGTKKEQIIKTKEYKTALLLDSIYSELVGLSYSVDKNKQNSIDEKISKLEEKSIEYSNIFQLKIKILREILNDYKGITGKELDKKGIIDFKYNFNLFSKQLEKPFEKIKTKDIAIVLDNKFSKRNEINKDKDLNELYEKFKKDILTKLEYVLRNNKNTKVVFFDYQFSDDFLDELGVIIKKYSREDIKIVFSAGDDISTNRHITEIGGIYASTLVGLDSNFEHKLAKASYENFINSEIKTKGIVTKYLTNSKELMTVSNTINILINPRNLSKNIPRKYDKKNNCYYNDYKNTKNKLNTYRDIDKTELPDTKIILFGAEHNGNRDSEFDVFTNKDDGTAIAGTEVLANTILNNDLNSI